MAASRIAVVFSRAGVPIARIPLRPARRPALARPATLSRGSRRSHLRFGRWRQPSFAGFTIATASRSIYEAAHIQHSGCSVGKIDLVQGAERAAGCPATSPGQAVQQSVREGQRGQCRRHDTDASRGGWPKGRRHWHHTTIPAPLAGARRRVRDSTIPTSAGAEIAQPGDPLPQCPTRTESQARGRRRS